MKMGIWGSVRCSRWLVIEHVISLGGSVICIRMFRLKLHERHMFRLLSGERSAQGRGDKEG